MLSTSSAEDHLRVIRSLMEKATVYRAISAHAAVVAGTLACLAGLGFRERYDHWPQDAAMFFGKWFTVLILSVTVNFYFLRRDAVRRGEMFFSAGMRMALRAMLPSLVCGALFTFLVSEELVVMYWMLFYGLALLSTVHFAPKSLERLGWAFLAAALSTGGALVGGYVEVGLAQADPLMACTFGLFHLIYAACTWPRRTSAAEVALA